MITLPNEWEVMEYQEIHGMIKTMYFRQPRLGIILLYTKSDYNKYQVNLGNWFYGNYFYKVSSGWQGLFWLACVIFCENENIDKRYIASYGYEYYMKEIWEWSSNR